jgi:hypothetical protein
MLSSEHEEKRDFHRMEVDCPVSCVLRNGGEPFTAVSKDLSATGILIHCGRELAVGDELEVSVAEGVATVPPLKALVEVTRVQALDGGGFELGTVIRQML